MIETLLEQDEDFAQLPAALEPVLPPAPHGAESARPSRAEMLRAVRTMIRWAGDDPDREGMRDTPERVMRAYGEWFRGYGQDLAHVLERTFDDVGTGNDIIMLREIPFRSFCEHHMAPIRGVAHVAYKPAGRVVGISKIVRVVRLCAARFQVQERLTDDIASTIQRGLAPLGVAVAIEAEHDCMSSRGVNAHGVSMLTKRMTGVFETDRDLRREFLDSLPNHSSGH